MTIARWDWRNSRGQLVSPQNLDIRKAKQSLAQHHVRYVLAQFVAIYGAAKSKAVPGEHVEAHSPAPRICTRDGNPAGITTQTPVLSARLDPVLSGGRLANYLKVMTLEEQTTARVRQEPAPQSGARGSGGVDHRSGGNGASSACGYELDLWCR